MINYTEFEQKIETKEISPNKLPFLQAQVLQKIFIDFHENKQTSIDELSELTDYSKDSKILKETINSLIKRDFLKENLGSIKIPNHSKNLMENFIKETIIKTKQFSDTLIKFCKMELQLILYLNLNQTISDLNKYGAVHKWYDYLEDFPIS